MRVDARLRGQAAHSLGDAHPARRRLVAGRGRARVPVLGGEHHLETLAEPEELVHVVVHHAVHDGRRRAALHLALQEGVQRAHHRVQVVVRGVGHLAALHRLRQHELRAGGFRAVERTRLGDAVFERQRAHRGVEDEAHRLAGVTQVRALAVQEEPQAQVVQLRVGADAHALLALGLVPHRFVVRRHERGENHAPSRVGVFRIRVVQVGRPPVSRARVLHRAVEHTGVLAPVLVVLEQVRVRLLNHIPEVRLRLTPARDEGLGVHGVAQPVRQRLHGVAQVGRHLHRRLRERRVEGGLLQAEVGGERLGNGAHARGDARAARVGRHRPELRQVVVQAGTRGGQGPGEGHADGAQA